MAEPITEREKGVAPDALRELIDMIGYQAVADRLGCAEGTLRNFISKGVATKVYEVAAEGLMTYYDNPQIMLLVTGPEETVESVRPVLAAFNLKVTDIGENK